MNRLSARTRLAIAIAAALLLVIAAVTVQASRSLTLSMRDALGKQEHLRTQVLAERLDGMLQARRLALASLAEALPPPHQRTAATMHAAMASQHALTGAFLNIALLAKSGELIYSAPKPATRPFTAAARPYFLEALLNKREVMSAPFTSNLSGAPVVVLAYPLPDAKGEVDYVLSASIPLAGTPLAADPDDDERLYYVMTTEGYLVSHPQAARITHHVNEVPELAGAASLGLQGFQGWRQLPPSDRVHAFARLRQAPWIVGLQTPGMVVFRTFTAAHDRLILAATALSAVALAAAWLLSLMVPKRAESAAQRPAPATAWTPTQAPPAMDPTGDAEHAPVAPAAPPAPRSATPLDLDAFMLQNFTSEEQRRSFLSTVAASARKLPGDISAVSANPQTAPPMLHTLKGAWGSLGAAAFAQAAGELESAIKQQHPYDTQLMAFTREAAGLREQVESWLSCRGTQATATLAAPQQSAEPLLPLLRERSINASTVYEGSRAYWDGILGAAAPTFAAAMDALDFATAERLLAGVSQDEP